MTQEVLQPDPRGLRPVPGYCRLLAGVQAASRPAATTRHRAAANGIHRAWPPALGLDHLLRAASSPCAEPRTTLLRPLAGTLVAARARGLPVRADADIRRVVTAGPGRCARGEWQWPVHSPGVPALAPPWRTASTRPSGRPGRV